MKCKLSEKCKFGNLCKDATRHDSLTVLGCSSFKAKKLMTNEEYIRSCSFNELAECLTEVVLSDRRFRMTMVGGIEETKEWLKEKHNER